MDADEEPKFRFGLVVCYRSTRLRAGWLCVGARRQASRGGGEGGQANVAAVVGRGVCASEARKALRPARS